MIGKKYKKREFGCSTKIAISKENVTLEGLYDLIGDTKNAYCLMSEYGFYLPEFTSDIMSLEYMMDILTGRTWCPMQSEIKMVRPASGISKSQLKEEVLRLRPDTRLNIYSDPDKEWLTAILSTLNPEHHFLQLEEIGVSKEIPKKLLDKLRLEFLKGEKEKPKTDDSKKEQPGVVSSSSGRNGPGPSSNLTKRGYSSQKADDYESEEEEFSEEEMEPTENMEMALKRNQKKAAALMRQLKATEEEIERLKNNGVKEPKENEEGEEEDEGEEEEQPKEEETIEGVIGKYHQSEKAASLRLLSASSAQITKKKGKGRKKTKKNSKKEKSPEDSNKGENNEEIRIKQEEVVADAWNDMIFLGLSGKYA